MIALLDLPAGMALRDPAFLWLALLVVLAAWWRRRRGEPALPFAPAALWRPGPDDAAADPRRGRALPGSWRVALLPLPRVLGVLGLLCAVFALARPVRREPLPLVTEGIDILLCLDTSSSMTSNDLDRGRTRLDVAKDAAARFVAGRPHDRIGLLTFARYPDLRCPPTLNHGALSRILEGVRTVAGDGPEDATGVGTAVARAADVLRSGPGTSRVAILLTDGEENVATVEAKGEIAPAHAAQLCKALGVRVHVIVAGSGRIGPSGAWVPLDTRAVEGIAGTTGGTFDAAKDAGALERVYARIAELETTEFQDPRYEWVDRLLPFLLAALALLIVGRILESSVLGTIP